MQQTSNTNVVVVVSRFCNQRSLRCKARGLHTLKNSNMQISHYFPCTLSHEEGTERHFSNNPSSLLFSFVEIHEKIRAGLLAVYCVLVQHH